VLSFAACWSRNTKDSNYERNLRSRYSKSRHVDSSMCSTPANAFPSLRISRGQSLKWRGQPSYLERHNGQSNRATGSRDMGRRTRIQARAGGRAKALTNVTLRHHKRDHASRGVLRSNGIAMVPGHGAAFRLQHAQRPGRLPCNETSQGKRLRSCGTERTIDARGPALTPTYTPRRAQGREGPQTRPQPLPSKGSRGPAAARCPPAARPGCK
jgi:hypothetical protein